MKNWTLEELMYLIDSHSRSITLESFTLGLLTFHWLCFCSHLIFPEVLFTILVSQQPLSNYEIKVAQSVSLIFLNFLHHWDPYSNFICLDAVWTCRSHFSVFFFSWNFLSILGKRVFPNWSALLETKFPECSIILLLSIELPERGKNPTTS